MKTQLLFCASVVILGACQPANDIQPETTTLAGEVVGTYRTNLYLDPSYVARTLNQLPYAEVKAESATSVTIVYTEPYPTKNTQSIEHVTLLRQDAGIQLRVADSSIGTLQTDRVFTNNGMEKQGQLLRIKIPNSSSEAQPFVGSK